MDQGVGWTSVWGARVDGGVTGGTDNSEMAYFDCKR